jgi:hypothetical protein
MKTWSSLGAITFALLSLMLSASGCVVHSGGGYAEGYREGYWDRDHNRYWHDSAWHDCMENDIHCH